MKKKVVFTFIMIALSMFIAFANPGGESAGQSAASLYFLPTSLVNNQGKFIELSQPHSINDTKVGESFVNAYKDEYENDHLVVCCLMDTLNNAVQSDDVTINISSTNGFCFVQDDNATNTVPFEIEVVCAVFYKGNNSTNYSSRLVRQKMESDIAIGIDYTTTRNYGFLSMYTETLPYSESTVFNKESNSLYSITIPPTDYTNTLTTSLYFSAKDENKQYPNLVKCYYICIKTLGNANLAPGYYSATFTIAATENFLSAALGSTTGVSTPLSQTVTVRGYVGEEPEQNSSGYSFFVGAGNDTFFMDLAVAEDEDSPTYDVATVRFNRIYLNASNPSSDRKNKYVIYISPTDNYFASGTYKFRRIGSDAQQGGFANEVEYDLFLQTTDESGSGYTRIGDCNNLASSAYIEVDGKIEKAGKADVGNNTYYLYPLYTSAQTSSGTNTKYKEEWILQQHIYLQIADSSKETKSKLHQIGMYYSYIYFTVVTN